ncbi:MAG: GlmU family protein [Muribaculum sp.]|nr:GlmU family protein [Muribaculum sp.]
MRNIILYDEPDARENLLPITFTRPMADIRFGILTIRQKWELAFPGQYSYNTADYLSAKFTMKEVNTLDDYYIAGNVCPSDELVRCLEKLPQKTAIKCGDRTLARHGKECDDSIDIADLPLVIDSLTDIFIHNEDALVDDFRTLTNGRYSQPLSPTCTVIGDSLFPDGTPKIFLEPGATVEGAILNVSKGPIYVGKDAEIMEGTCVRGPLALCEHAYVNMGTKIYGATTIGPYCKVGGELNNVVMIGYSNKAHDGFLGNAVIGEWCNLGANCVASNLKNDYSEIKLWNYPAHRFLRTGLQFCGLIMGDHTKAGINTMFNTATVVGVGCNIYGSGFPRNFVASFSEGGASGFDDVSLNKFFEIARRVMARRNVELTETDMEIFKSIYEIAETYK